MAAKMIKKQPHNAPTFILISAILSNFLNSMIETSHFEDLIHI